MGAKVVDFTPFQFLKGTIRQKLVHSIDIEVCGFNSSKVRYDRCFDEYDEETGECFNSSKVRYDGIMPSSMGGVVRGFNSSKVRYDL